MITLLTNNKVLTPESAQVRNSELWLSQAEFKNLTGLSDDSFVSNLNGDEINLSKYSQQHSKPLLHNEAQDAWALGASAQERGAALKSLQAPDFTLADLDGKPHSLSDYRGKKIFLATWASW